jgi:hypothetical protein
MTSRHRPVLAAIRFRPATEPTQDRDPVKELLASVAQMVSFMQEPDGRWTASASFV